MHTTIAVYKSLTMCLKLFSTLLKIWRLVLWGEGARVCSVSLNSSTLYLCLFKIFNLKHIYHVRTVGPCVMHLSKPTVGDSNNIKNDVLSYNSQHANGACPILAVPGS